MSNRVTLDFKGRKVSGAKVDFEIENENWNKYSLDDGTKLKVRLVVAQIVRLENEYTPDGDPIYLINSTNIVTADVSEHLKKEVGGGGKVN